MIHYGPANEQDPKKAIYMGYSETNSWTLAADVPAHAASDKICFYVQTYEDKGQGANDIEKAKYLHDAEILGSEWSEKSEVKFE